jgi:predicted RNase H-like nuclease (RuvC/YqgF family)
LFVVVVVVVIGGLYKKNLVILIIQSKNANFCVILPLEQKVSALEEALRQKDVELQALEERNKKCIEKAKSVMETLDSKQNPVSAEAATLRNQLFEKQKIVEDLKVRDCVLQFLVLLSGILMFNIL